MNEQKTIIINKLPAPTWNRLKMNETVLTVDDSPCEATLTANSSDCLTALESTSLWNGISTGVGDELNTAVEGTPIYLVESKSGEVKETSLRAESVGESGAIRLYLHAKADSRLDVTLMCAGGSDSEEKHIFSAEIKVLAERGSRVNLYMAQTLPQGVRFLCGIGALCEENALFNLVKPEIGKADVYTGVLTELKGRRSGFHTDMCYVGRENQRLDFNYVVRHEGKHTVSDMNIVGSLKDNAFKLFRGSIDFVRGCAGAKGDEREEVLLLGGDPVNQTIPLILCSEEDVEGNHGASIGELDDKTLFYMAARGIPADEAERIIAKARVDSVSSKIPDETVRREIDEYMGGGTLDS